MKLDEEKRLGRHTHAKNQGQSLGMLDDPHHRSMMRALQLAWYIFLPNPVPN